VGERSICFAEAARFITPSGEGGERLPFSDLNIRPLRVTAAIGVPLLWLSLSTRVTVLSFCYSRARVRAHACFP
jgi:hypothetical protein